MNNTDVLNLIKNSEKKTVVKAYIQGNISGIDFGKTSKVINMGAGGIVIGDWHEVKLALKKNAQLIEDYYIESDRRNSAIDLMDTKELNARVEPGAVIREGVTIEDEAVVMMGVCINIGASVGEKTLIDMNAVIGGRAVIGKRCHIGSGVVIKGVISSPHASPVVIEDDVIIGPNAVIMEGIRIGKDAVIKAGTVVANNVNPGAIIG